jgi:hypothetical protein
MAAGRPQGRPERPVRARHDRRLFLLVFSILFIWYSRYTRQSPWVSLGSIPPSRRRHCCLASRSTPRSATVSPSRNLCGPTPGGQPDSEQQALMSGLYTAVGLSERLAETRPLPLDSWWKRARTGGTKEVHSWSYWPLSLVTPAAVGKDKAIRRRRQGRRAQPSTPEALTPSALSRSTLNGPQPGWHTLGSEDTG